jgi:hypothetical protein
MTMMNSDGITTSRHRRNVMFLVHLSRHKEALGEP